MRKLSPPAIACAVLCILMALSSPSRADELSDLTAKADKGDADSPPGEHGTSAAEKEKDKHKAEGHDKKDG